MKMKLKEYLLEMPDSILLDAGQFTKRQLKKMKRKYKTEDEFITVFKSKIKNLPSNDERRLRAAFKEI
jgi:hypothetical protein